MIVRAGLILVACTLGSACTIQPAEKILISFKYGGEGCKEPEPIAVSITNHTKTSMQRYEWQIEVRAEGHSSDLVDRNGIFGSDGSGASDYILEPDASVTFCQEMPSLVGPEEYRLDDLVIGGTLRRTDL